MHLPINRNVREDRKKQWSKMDHNPAEIQTRHPANKNVESYHYTNLLSAK